MKKKISVITLIFALFFMLAPTINADAATWPVIKRGNSGANVYALQYLLKYRGAYISTDGVFGYGTESAVKNFQKANLLYADGIVGGSTWSKLVVTVKSGSNNNAVKAAQYLLKYKYNYTVNVDGVYGVGTISAVTKFQSSKGLPADGVMGANTWCVLLGGTPDGVQVTTDFWKSRLSTWVYPLKGGATADPTINGRQFGAARDGGRAHAGVDFLAEPGRKVLAMTSGTVIRVSDSFYAGTKAVEIKNDDGTVARYCEISVSIQPGARVLKGQAIGAVMASSTGSSMLHLEMYMGTTIGALTDTSNTTYKYVTYKNYQRRSDLVDPMGARLLPIQY